MSMRENTGTTEYQYARVKKTIDVLKTIIFIDENSIEKILYRAEGLNNYDERSLDLTKNFRDFDNYTIIDNLNAEVLACVGILKMNLDVPYKVPFSFDNLEEKEILLKKMYLKLSKQGNFTMNNKKFIKFKMDILRYSFIF